MPQRAITNENIATIPKNTSLALASSDLTSSTDSVRYQRFAHEQWNKPISQDTTSNKSFWLMTTMKSVSLMKHHGSRRITSVLVWYTKTGFCLESGQITNKSRGRSECMPGHCFVLKITRPCFQANKLST